MLCCCRGNVNMTSFFFNLFFLGLYFTGLADCITETHRYRFIMLTLWILSPFSSLNQMGSILFPHQTWDSLLGFSLDDVFKKKKKESKKKVWNFSSWTFERNQQKTLLTLLCFFFLFVPPSSLQPIWVHGEEEECSGRGAGRPRQQEKVPADEAPPLQPQRGMWRGERGPGTATGQRRAEEHWHSSR